jgi:hypothetical protein
MAYRGSRGIAARRVDERPNDKAQSNENFHSAAAVHPQAPDAEQAA